MLVKNPLPKVLICDDDKVLHLAIKTALSNDFDIRSAYNGDEAVAILKNHQMDIVLLDMEMRHEREGIETIPRIRAVQDNVEILIFSGKLDFTYVRDAMKLGANDYIPKDTGPEELRLAFDRTLQAKQLKNKNIQNQFELKRNHQSHSLVGESDSIKKIRKQIDRAKNSPAPLIIFGETGTGKEVVARLLRRTLPDQTLEPFVSVDSSTIQSSIAESLLFGYEKGSFTGAEKTTRGLFEEANGGTIYFDELANMPLDIQNKLLRVIQEKEVLRMGASKPIELSFRIICATNQDLETLVKQGNFKEDLLQRLNVLQISLPPLRERKEDIPQLIRYFSELNQQNLPELNFLPETISTLQSYDFTGNVRELANLVLYLYTMCDGPDISPLDLPPKFRAAKVTNSPLLSPNAAQKNFYQAVEGFERDFLTREYERLDGNVSKMAIELEMDRSYLHSKLKNYDIHQSKRLKD